MGEVKSISSLLCICQHISRRPGHIPGTGWPGTEPDTAHLLAPEPRLGGRLLFLWLNSQAGRAGAAPSDSWSCSLTLARRERPVLPLSPHLPLLTAELGSFDTFFCSLTAVTRGLLLCAQRAAVVKHTSPGTGVRKGQWDLIVQLLLQHTVSHLPQGSLPNQRKMLLEHPAFRDVHTHFQRIPAPKDNQPLTCQGKELNLTFSLLRCVRLSDPMWRTHNSSFQAHANTSEVATVAT